MKLNFLIGLNFFHLSENASSSKNTEDNSFPKVALTWDEEVIWTLNTQHANLVSLLKKDWFQETFSIKKIDITSIQQNKPINPKKN